MNIAMVEAFRKGNLIYNARTKKDAKAFLAECEKCGMVWRDGKKPSSFLLWKGKDSCYRNGGDGIGFLELSTAHEYLPTIPIFPETWERHETPPAKPYADAIAYAAERFFHQFGHNKEQLQMGILTAAEAIALVYDKTTTEVYIDMETAHNACAAG